MTDTPRTRPARASRRRRRAKRSGSRALNSLWPIAVAIIVATAAGFGVNRVRMMSESISYPPVTNTIPATVVQINPKNVTYEVFGVLGGGGKATYANLDSEPVEVMLTSLPWSVSETTTSPSASLSLVTQVDGDSVGCRIWVDGRIHDEQVVNHPTAAAACTVTAA